MGLRGARALNLRPRYNGVPGQDVAMVRATDDRRRLDILGWGLIPAWAKDPATGHRLINAQSETAAETSATCLRAGRLFP